MLTGFAEQNKHFIIHYEPRDNIDRHGANPAQITSGERCRHEDVKCHEFPRTTTIPQCNDISFSASMNVLCTMPSGSLFVFLKCLSLVAGMMNKHFVLVFATASSLSTRTGRIISASLLTDPWFRCCERDTNGTRLCAGP